MKFQVIVVVSMSLALLAPPASAQVDEEQELCQFYGELGGQLAAYVLPLTIQQLVGVMAGRDEQIKNDLQTMMISALSEAKVSQDIPRRMNRMTRLASAAGKATFDVMLKQQVATSEEVATFMTEDCLNVGVGVVMHR